MPLKNFSLPFELSTVSKAQERLLRQVVRFLPIYVQLRYCLHRTGGLQNRRQAPVKLFSEKFQSHNSVLSWILIVKDNIKHVKCCCHTQRIYHQGSPNQDRRYFPFAIQKVLLSACFILWWTVFPNAGSESRSQSLDVFQGTNITFESSVKVVSTCSGLLRPTKKPHSHYQQPWRLRRATSQDASLPSQTSFKSLKIFFGAIQNWKMLFSEPPLKQKSGSSGPFSFFYLLIHIPKVLTPFFI